MKFLPLAILLCLPACKTTTHYHAEGGKTVVREADPVAIQIAGAAFGRAIVHRYPVDRSK
jgi:hypothetical protein